MTRQRQGQETIDMYERAGLEMQPAPCPQCGARNEDEANTLCRQSQDQSGEYECAGEFTDDGISVQPTPESLKAMNDWIDAEVAKDEAQHRGGQ